MSIYVVSTYLLEMRRSRSYGLLVERCLFQNRHSEHISRFCSVRVLSMVHLDFVFLSKGLVSDYGLRNLQRTSLGMYEDTPASWY